MPAERTAPSVPSQPSAACFAGKALFLLLALPPPFSVLGSFPTALGLRAALGCALSSEAKGWVER
jgi:hypothetical protein